MFTVCGGVAWRMCLELAYIENLKLLCFGTSLEQNGIEGTVYCLPFGYKTTYWTTKRLIRKAAEA